jgi:hypothetical protein
MNPAVRKAGRDSSPDIHSVTRAVPGRGFGQLWQTKGDCVSDKAAAFGLPLNDAWQMLDNLPDGQTGGLTSAGRSLGLFE